MSQARNNSMTEQINAAIDKLIPIDKDNFKKFKLDIEKLKAIEDDIQLADIIRNKLFTLRTELNRYNDGPEIIAAKSFVQEKLVELAREYPLNKKSRRGGIFCPVSGEAVCLYSRNRHDIPLSNGYIYDSAGLAYTLDRDKRLPSLPNLSEDDIHTLLTEHNDGHKREVFSISIFAGGMLFAFGFPGLLFGMKAAGLLVGAATMTMVAAPVAAILIPLLIGAAIGFTIYQLNKTPPEIEGLTQNSSMNTINNGLGVTSGSEFSFEFATTGIDVAPTHPDTSTFIPAVSYEASKSDTPVFAFRPGQ